VWLNGPGHSQQLSGGWPDFGSPSSGSNGGECDVTDEDVRYTGYNVNGGFCRKASDSLDAKPHLVIYSGIVGVVLDASAGSGSLFPQLGSTGTFPFLDGLSASEVSSGLAVSAVTATTTLKCSNKSAEVLTAKPNPDKGSTAEFGLVRQGHAVTHVTVDNLKWLNETGKEFTVDDACNGKKISNRANCKFNYEKGNTFQTCLDPDYPTCVGFVEGKNWGKCFSDPLVRRNETCSASFGEPSSGNNPCDTDSFPLCKSDKCFPNPVEDPDKPQCNQDNGGKSKPCSKEYQTCVGFKQGISWGTCFNNGSTNAEVCDSDKGTVGGSCQDPVFPICNENGKCSKDPSTCFLEPPWFDVTTWGDSIALHFHWGATPGCSGTVQFEAQMDDKTVTHTAVYEEETVIEMLLTGQEGASTLSEETGGGGLDDLVVTSSERVTKRPSFGDVVVALGNSIHTCDYKPCGNRLSKVDVSVANSNVSESQTVRLTLRRNTKVNYDGSYPSRIGAEITGMNVMVWDKNTQQPIGIPLHISKNWHDGNGSSIYRGTWWTANLLFHLPPSHTLDLTFAIVYEQFKGIPAFSHAQLSIVGYSTMWLWEEAALGTGGENFVMDPQGSHTRAVITDVRPKLFDGRWKENVGGGDFLLYFDAAGSMQYKKGLDAQLFANGPCLSDALYTSVSLDEAIKSEVRIGGGRTDDLVRVFFHIKYTAMKDTNFSRLVFFQMGGETYNYHATFASFVFGNRDNISHDLARTCTAATRKKKSQMYNSENSGKTVYRETLPGDGPWWLAMGPNTDLLKYTLPDDTMVVGDRGLIIRSYTSSFGGVAYDSPSVSILCDKIELGPPSEVSMLKKGDVVEMKLEMLVLPRQEDFALTLNNSPNSKSLKYLSDLGTTWERVRAHAIFDISVTSDSPGVRVESHYPVRIFAPPMPVDGSFGFKITGQALGFVPIVLCDLDSVVIPSGHGLWERPLGDSVYTLMTDAVDARQGNYVRLSGKYELVFNIETVNVEYTEYAFGPDPN